MKTITQSPAADIESLIAEAADRFTDEIKQGRAPSIEYYAEQYPDIAAIIRQVFPALAVLDLNATTALSSGTTAGLPSSAHAEGATAGLLGDFRILHEIGRGGMGVVYEAEQLSLGRRVALKVLPFAAMLDRQQLARFKNEARAAATLDHPNIVAIHSVGCERGVHYYAMQLIEGQSLAQVVEQLKGDCPNFAQQNGTVPLLPLPPGEGRNEVEQQGARIEKDCPPPLHGEGLGEGCRAGGGSPDPAHPASSIDTAPIARLTTLPNFSSKEYFKTVAQLGIQAAEALDHAHQNGILHRDIKPANLLLECHTPSPLRGGVGRGSDDASHLKLWITDFGLARMEQDAGMTMTGDLLGTLRYMSPEQALAKRTIVDHRSDIYSLGVTLYELLTLQPAYSATDRQELLRQIAFDEPRKPRQINSHIPHDLETIVLKAIEKDPADRYEAAQELADDLRRFHGDEPIRALRTTWLVRLTKWTRRNKPLVTAAAVVFLSLTVGSGIATWQAIRATQERDRAVSAERTAETNAENARTEAAIAQAVNEFLQQDLLGQADITNQPGGGEGRDPDIKVRTLLDRASQTIEGRFAGQPLTEAAVRLTIGDAYRALGRHPQAQSHLEQSVQLLVAQRGANHPDVLTAKQALARLYWEQGRYDRAELLLTEVLQVRTAKLGHDHPNTVTSKHNLAMVYEDQAKYDQAEQLLLEVRDAHTRILGSNHPDALTSNHNLATLYMRQSKYDAAEPVLLEVLEAQIATLGADHPHTLNTKNSLGFLYQARSKLEKAEPLLRDVLEAQTAKLGPEHHHTLSSKNNLALVYQSRGDYARAEEVFLELVRVRTTNIGADHPDTLTCKLNLASVYDDQGKHAQAEPLFWEVTDAWKRSAGADSPQFATALAKLGTNLVKQKKWTDAEAILRQSFSLWQNTAPDAWQTFRAQALLGQSLLGQGKNDQAEPLLIQGFEGIQQRQAKIPARRRVRYLTEALESLVQLYEQRGDAVKGAGWRADLNDLNNREAED